MFSVAPVPSTTSTLNITQGALHRRKFTEKCNEWICAEYVPSPDVIFYTYKFFTGVERHKLIIRCLISDNKRSLSLKPLSHILLFLYSAIGVASVFVSNVFFFVEQSVHPSSYLTTSGVDFNSCFITVSLSVRSPHAMRTLFGSWFHRKCLSADV